MTLIKYRGEPRKSTSQNQILPTDIYGIQNNVVYYYYLLNNLRIIVLAHLQPTQEFKVK